MPNYFFHRLMLFLRHFITFYEIFQKFQTTSMGENLQCYKVNKQIYFCNKKQPDFSLSAAVKSGQHLYPRLPKKFIYSQSIT